MKSREGYVDQTTRYNLMTRAHGKVSTAVKCGDLPKVNTLQCIDCGLPARQYDHRDYYKPLAVVPTCISCNHKRGPATPYTYEPGMAPSPFIEGIILYKDYSNSSKKELLDMFALGLALAKRIILESNMTPDGIYDALCMETSELESDLKIKPVDGVIKSMFDSRAAKYGDNNHMEKAR